MTDVMKLIVSALAQIALTGKDDSAPAAMAQGQPSTL
jgi:hypothetical protein